MYHPALRPAPLAFAIAVAFAAAPTFAQTANTVASAAPATAEATLPFKLSARPLADALADWALQTRTQLIVAPGLVRGRTAPAVDGLFTPREALQRLLAGSGLAVRTEGNAVVITEAAAAPVGILPAVTATASAADATENSGAYTTGVTSTATKLKLSIRETPQTISVITRQRIDDQGINTMTDVLNQVPGITMSQDGQRYNIYARGSAINTYLFDGVATAQENQTRHMPNTFLDMALYDHIEVVRGATGLMTGAGEPGGVVNLIRKKPTQQFQAHVQASAGSWDTYRADGDVSGALNDSGSVRARAVATRQTGNSYIDRYQLDKEIAYGVIEADLGDATLLRLSMDYQKFKPRGATGVPLLFDNGVATHLPRSTSVASRWNSDAMATYNTTATLEHKLGNTWTLRAVANYMDGDRHVLGGNYSSSSGRSYINQQTGLAEISLGRAYSHQIQKGVDINVQGPFTLLGRQHELTAGVNYGDYRSRYDYSDGDHVMVDLVHWNGQLDYPANTGVVESVFNVASRQRGAYAATRLNVADGFNVFVGARVSDYDFDYLFTMAATNYDQRYGMRERGKVTPYAGVTYDLAAQQTVYASYADIFKPQSSRDRNGRVLDPVIGKNYELGWKGEYFGGLLNATAAVFRIERDNLAADDTGYLVPGTNDVAARAIQGAKTEGADVEISGELAPGWQVQTSLSHATTRDDKGVRTLKHMAATTARLWTTYQLPGAWQGLTIGGGASWNADSSLAFARYNAVIRQPSYATAALMARYRFSPHWVATLNINNVFDKRFYAGMTGSMGHFGDPRNAVLTVRYDF